MIKLRYLLLFSLLFLSKTLFAQYEVVKAWANAADQKDFSFGFTFQYVSTDFKIVKKPDWRAPFYDAAGVKATDSLSSIGSPASQGFAVGFISRYSINDHLEARITPTLVFADRILDYTYASPQPQPSNSISTGNPNIIEKQVQTTMAEFPLSMKLKSDRLGNFRAYLLAGVKYSFLVGGNKPDDNADPINKTVKNVGSFASYEAGIGCDIYFEYFKLSPEIKVSNSFGNMLVAENHPFSRPIDKLFLHTLMISFHFE
jgi:hypothetical protein